MYEKELVEKIDEIESILNSKGVEVIRNSNIIDPYIIELYVPELKLGFGFNNMYEHREILSADKHNILFKYTAAKEKGIRIINFFDIEVIRKFDICLSIILNSVGKTANRFFARKCKMREITPLQAYTFYEENHMQGGRYASYNYGLFSKGELLSCVSMSKPRNKNHNDAGYLEILRYANKINCSVVGGFSKLIKFFFEKNTGSKLMTFSDIRLFAGNGYFNNGFKLIHSSGPNYFYFRIDDEELYKSHSRNAFQKHKLAKLPIFDINKTEFENMTINEWFRVYDCGNYVMEYVGKENVEK